MGLKSLAATVPSPGPDVVTLTSGGQSLTFRRPEPEDLANCLQPKVLEELNAAAEMLVAREAKAGREIVIPPKLLTLDYGYNLHLLAACYVADETDMEGGEKFYPLVSFMSIAASNAYSFSLLVSEFEGQFPQFVEYVYTRIQGFLPGNFSGGGTPGQSVPTSTPGEASPPAAEPSDESPASTTETLDGSPDSAGNG